MTYFERLVVGSGVHAPDLLLWESARVQDSCGEGVRAGQPEVVVCLHSEAFFLNVLTWNHSGGYILIADQ